MKKTILLLVTLLIITSMYGQEKLNEYKYIIVPNTFVFLKEADQYQLNSLTKFLFEKYNFEALMEDEIKPSDLEKNTCLSLKANVLKESSLLNTKLTIILKNCRNEVIYTSVRGESREKKYKTAYNKALRAAFKSFETLNYQYNPKSITKTDEDSQVVENATDELQKLKEEVKAPKAKNKVEKIKDSSVKPKVKKDTVKTLVSKNTLFAQATGNGFHLMDKSPQVVYTLLNSGKKELFIVKDRDAVIYKLNGKWVLAEVIEDNVKLKTLEIKF